MYEPRFKGFPDEYERKIGDTYWQGICDISVEEDKQVKALRDSRLEEGLTTYDEVIKIIKKFPIPKKIYIRKSNISESKLIVGIIRDLIQ